MNRWQMMFRASTFSVVTATATLLILGSGQSATRDTGIRCSAWTTPVPAGADVSLNVEILNPGSAADRLLDVRCAEAQRVEILRGVRDWNLTWVAPVDNVSIPAGTSLEFKPGGSHELLLTGAEGNLESGKVVRLQFVFEIAGVVTSDVTIR